MITFAFLNTITKSNTIAFSHLSSRNSSDKKHTRSPCSISQNSASAIYIKAISLHLPYLEVKKKNKDILIKSPLIQS